MNYIKIVNKIRKGIWNHRNFVHKGEKAAVTFEDLSLVLGNIANEFSKEESIEPEKEFSHCYKCNRIKEICISRKANRDYTCNDCFLKTCADDPTDKLKNINEDINNLLSLFKDALDEDRVGNYVYVKTTALQNIKKILDSGELDSGEWVRFDKSTECSTKLGLIKGAFEKYECAKDPGRWDRFKFNLKTILSDDSIKSTVSLDEHQRLEACLEHWQNKSRKLSETLAKIEDECNQFKKRTYCSTDHHVFVETGTIIAIKRILNDKE